MQKRYKKFANSKKTSKILHGCQFCGNNTYLSAFLTHKGMNYCVCGSLFSPMSKKRLRGAI